MIWRGGGTVLLGLLIIGWTLQMEGVRFNSAVKIIDILMNLVVMGMSFFLMRGGGREALVGGFLFYRAYYNISPLLKIMLANYTREPTQRSVQETCCEARRDMVVNWQRRFERPCIYVANHALWSLDDVVAMGAISRRNLPFVVNTGPAGLTGIPWECREYVCVIGRRKNSRGEGYEIMKEMMREEIMKNKKSLIVFVDDMRGEGGIRSGTINLALELGIPMIPIWIEWPGIFPSILTSGGSKFVSIREGEELGRGECEEIKKEIIRKWVLLRGG
jgi:hypothetical protein